MIAIMTDKDHDRVALCETLMRFCHQFGVNEVQEESADVVNAIKVDTSEMDFEELANVESEAD